MFKTIFNVRCQLHISFFFSLSLKDSNSESTGRKLLASFTATVLGHLNKEMSSI